MEVKSVGTFPEILLKLATPPLQPQTKLNLEQNGCLFWPQHCQGKWGDDRMNPKPNKKLSLGAGSYVTIAWRGFSHSPKFFCPPLQSYQQQLARMASRKTDFLCTLTTVTRYKMLIVLKQINQTGYPTTEIKFGCAHNISRLNTRRACRVKEKIIIF